MGKKSASQISGELHQETGYHGHTLVLHVAAVNNFIIIGDLMKSISLLEYKPLSGTIEEIARDYNSNWMCSIFALDENNFVGAEGSGNLFVVQRDLSNADENEKMRLNTTAALHWGDYVNVMCKGSLAVNQEREKESGVEKEWFEIDPKQRLMFGTVGGGLGEMKRKSE